MSGPWMGITVAVALLLAVSARAEEGAPDPPGGSAGVARGLSSPLSLGFADFRPQSAASDGCLYDAPIEGNGGFVAASSPSAVCCLVAPVRLPHGATIDSVIFWVRDASLDDVVLSLRRKRIDAISNSTVLGSITTDGSNSSVRVFVDVTIADAVVDNERYSYFVSTDSCLDQDLDLRLYSTLVVYSEAS